MPCSAHLLLGCAGNLQGGVFCVGGLLLQLQGYLGVDAHHSNLLKVRGSVNVDLLVIVLGVILL